MSPPSEYVIIHAIKKPILGKIKKDRYLLTNMKKIKIESIKGYSKERVKNDLLK